MKTELLNWYSTILSGTSLLLAFLSPVYFMVLVIGFMIVCDAVTGVMASRKRGDKFNSGRLRDSIDKFISYGIGILLSFLIQHFFISDFPALKSITALICYIEIKSINENIEVVTGLNLFKGILSALNIKNKKGQ